MHNTYVSEGAVSIHPIIYVCCPLSEDLGYLNKLVHLFVRTLYRQRCLSVNVNTCPLALSAQYDISEGAEHAVCPYDPLIYACPLYFRSLSNSWYVISSHRIYTKMCQCVDTHLLAHCVCTTRTSLRVPRLPAHTYT